MAEFRLGTESTRARNAHSKELHATPGEVCDWVPICASFASIDGGGALAATRQNTIAQGIALGSKGSALGSKGNALGSKGKAERRITPSIR
jgi:hypothetical protein